jgi:hypothetical protein
VPLSTSLIIAHLLSTLFDKFREQIGRYQVILIGFSLLVILFVVQGGIAVQRTRNNKYYKQPTLPMMSYVKQTKTPSQVYLIPTRDNKFDEFRLYTGAPVFINWKSHPYRDFEVVEWYNRNQLAEEFYNSDSPIACSVLQELSSSYQITHVVLNLNQPNPECNILQEMYRDDHYAVHAIADKQSIQ